jgi:hypothetical protein
MTIFGDILSLFKNCPHVILQIFFEVVKSNESTKFTLKYT